MSTTVVTSRSLDLKIEYRAVSALRVAGRALRRSKAGQVDAVARSIERFGFLNPLLIDKDGQVLVGRVRYAAAKSLSLAAVPTILIDHLTAEEKRAYTIAENRLAELSEWDRDALTFEIRELSALDLDFSLEITGFSKLEIEALVFGAEGFGDDPPLQFCEGPPVTALGQVWNLGQHRLMCADATAPSSYDLLLGADRVRTIFTDPPYNTLIEHIRPEAGGREFVAGAGELSASEFCSFLERALGAMSDHAVDGALAYVCMDWRHAGDVLSAANENGLALLNLCVWDKGQGGMGSFYRSQHELVFVLKKGKGAHINNVELGRHGRNRTNVWAYAGANGTSALRRDLKRHPTPKPVAMVADALLDSSAEGDIVLDPFCGGGTILIASERTKRRARAMDLDPLYVDAAVRRWQVETGLQATCAHTGLSFADLEAESRREVGHG